MVPPAFRLHKDALHQFLLKLNYTSNGSAFFYPLRLHFVVLLIPTEGKLITFKYENIL